MRVSCLQENLAKGLSIVSRAVSSRSSLPVLANVLMATEGGRLRLSATNLELGITCWIGARVEEEGSTTVPARIFTELVSTLPSGPLDLTLIVRTQTLHVRSARSEANIKGIDAQEFPLMPSADSGGPEVWSASLPSATLREMLSQVVFAAATDESRPILTGVQARFQGKQLTLAAADGFRLSIRKAALDQAVDTPLNVILPARALNELARVLGEDEGSVRMIMLPGRSQMVFAMKDITLVSQLIEGNFPDIGHIIPRTSNTRAVVQTDELLKSCKQADIFARESAHTARLSVTPGTDIAPGHVTVTAAAAETGDNVGEIDATVDGSPLEIAFNVRYLIDVLNVVGTDRVILETLTSSSPGVIKPVGNDDFQHIIMPMHVTR